ncbi:MULTISPECIES: hypothetical protein [unclassified Chelatococcus]|uniref:pyroglutamyl-peptidase I family protein n=1 Tax=unclassified Chelatococcus TaxID=2638111 RepID=UPI000311BDF3|nr:MULTISPECIES: hypothetical protein [unclassified Chelatococcus]ALA18804.1 hypothetical protein AL346_17065 [Chelatococcus sp. CO-6]
MGKRNKRCDILITGFGPFPRVPVNPTAVLAERVGGSRRLARLGIRAEHHVFRTRYAILDKALPTRLDAARPRAVLMLGVAARARHVRVETRAVNKANRTAPDASGKTRRGAALAKGAPLVRRSPAPLARLKVAMAGTGMPVRRSIDAGRYLCNASYFTALGQLEEKRPSIPVVFIHVPMPSAWASSQTPRPKRRNSTADASAKAQRPTLAAMARALETAAVVLARESARRRVS